MNTRGYFAFLVLITFTFCHSARAALPAALTLYPTNITTNSATLNASVNPGGLTTTAFFEWGISTNYGATTAPQAMGSGSSPVALQANLSSLVTDTVYHYRAVASNASGIAYGSNIIVTPTILLYLYAGESWTYVFHDLPIFNYVGTANATNVGTFDILPGSFTPGGSVRLEMFKDSTNQLPFSSGVFNFPAMGGTLIYDAGTDPAWYDHQGAVRLTMLTGAVVVTSFQFSEVEGFHINLPRYLNTITPTKFPQPAVLGTQFVSAVSIQSAVVRANINARNLSTQVFVQWGSDTNYGFASAATMVNFDYFVTRDIAVSNLPLNAVTHLRVVATNSAGVTYGKDLVVEQLGPIAFTEKPTNITTNSATLNGIAVPSGLPTTAFFQWGTTTNYGMTTAPQAIGSGSSPVAVQANLASLVTDTVYHYRIVASNASGVVYGSNVIVTPTLLLYLYAGESWSYTFHDLPYAGVYSFPDTPQDRFRFNYLPGSFAPGTTMRLEAFPDSTNSGGISIIWTNSTAGFFNNYPSFLWPDLQGAIRLTMLTGSVVVTDLTFWRFENGSPRTQYANTIIPTKFPQPAALGTQFVSSVSIQSAVISANINAKNLSTALFVEWGTTTNYGSVSSPVLVNFDYVVSRDLTVGNLPPGTALHARVVATNSAGTTYGRDLAFSTPAPATVTTLDANNITSTSTVLNASVTLNGLATSAYFQWGTTTNYGQVTSLQNLGNPTTVTNITAALSGLSPITSYHFRAVVFSSGVTNRGEDVVFNTPQPPNQFIVTNVATDDVRGAIERGGLVTFAADGVLALNSQIEIANDVCLDATGHALTLSGSNVTRIFKVLPGITLTLTNIALANGRTNEGGAIYNEGTVIAQKCQFIGNTAVGTNGVNGTNGAKGTDSSTPGLVTRGQPGQDGSPGQDAAGGAIHSIGSLDLAHCLFISNSVFAGKGGAGGKGGNGGRLLPGGASQYRDGGDGGLPGAAGNARGGSLVSLGTLAMRNCTFSDSVSRGGDGGAGGSGGNLPASAFGVTNGAPTPTNGLHQAGANGGAAQGGAVFSLGDSMISNCLLKMNDSFGGNGGVGGSSPTGAGGGPGALGGTGGQAEGGGIRLGTNDALTGSTIWSNRAIGGSGGIGGAYNSGRSGRGGFAFGAGGIVGHNSSIVNCTFVTNNAAGGTGGTAVTDGSSQIYGGNGGNAFGGGLFGFGTSSATNITLAGNSALRGMASETNLGGGIFLSFLRATNGNGFGGSIATTGGVFQIVNSILAGGVSNNCFGSITDLGHNISSDATPTWTSGTSVNNTDALLQPLADNGGPTLTIALSPGSPALSNADPASSPAMDQRGVARPLGGGYDIGAFEGPYTPPLYVLRGGGSAMTLRWAAYAGQTYRVNVSSNLVNWTPFSTNTAIGNGWLDVPVSANSLLRFFRLSSE